MVVTGGWGGIHWAVGWGSPEKKLGTVGGLEGWPVRRRTGGEEWFRGGRGGAGRSRAARAGGSAGGGWRLRGVEFDDKLEALDFVSNGWKI